MTEKDVLEPTERGVPLVATWGRWAVATALGASAFVIIVEAYLAFSHAERPLASYVLLILSACALLAALLWLLLGAEELRLARELRTARTGTSVLRAIVTRRRKRP